MVQVAFFAGAIGAIGGAIGVVALRNPFYSVLALVVHLVALAGLFLLLYAQFVAAAQVVVYAGAVMVLYVFVAAYVGAVEEPIWEPIPGQRFLAPLLAVALFVELSIAILGTGLSALDSEGPDGAARLRLAGCDRQPAARALPGRLRGGLDAAAGGRGRARSCWQAIGTQRRGVEVAAPMDVTWYLVLSALLFAIGAGGVLIRRSPLVILLCLELMLNAGNLALVAFARDARRPGRPGVRADRDGGRRLRGGGRAGADRGDVQATAAAERR